MGQGVFSESGLVSVDLREYPLSEIPDNTFYQTKLVTAELPDTITSVGHALSATVRSLLRFHSAAEKTSGLCQTHSTIRHWRKYIFRANLTYIGEYSLVGLQHLDAFEVSEENPKYKAVDGLLCSKDGRKLIAGSCRKNGNNVTPQRGRGSRLRCV